MKAIIYPALGVAGLLANVSAYGQYTADDFCGNGKICTQLFYGSEMVEKRVQEGCWSEFEKISDTQIRLKSIKNGGSVTFTINGDKLLLDGANERDGVPTTDADGESIHLCRMEHETYERKILLPKDEKGIYHRFKYAPGTYAGNIIVDEDNNLTIVFEESGKDLMFHYGSIAQRLEHPNESAGHKEYNRKSSLNSFSRIEFHILHANSEMSADVSGNQSPIYTQTIENEDGTQSIFMRNYAGKGEHYYYYGTSPDYTLLPKGIELVLDPENHTYTIERQAYSGTVNYTTQVNSAAYNQFRVTGTSYGNFFTEDKNTSAQPGKYTVDNTEVHNGWHHRLGGEFAVHENLTLQPGWTAYFLDSQNTQTDVYSETTPVNMHLDITPEVRINVDECLYNTLGVYVSGSVEVLSHPEIADNYEIFMVGGKHENIKSDPGFDGTHVNGHSSAIPVANGEESLCEERGMTFEKFFPMSELTEIGFDPYNTNDYITLYAKINVKETHEPENVRQNAPAREAAARYGFAALSPTAQTLVTSVNEIETSRVRVYAEKGGLYVSGTDAEVSIFDISGATAYTGAGGHISLSNGLYIVKAGDKTVKVIVK